MGREWVGPRKHVNLSLHGCTTNGVQSGGREGKRRGRGAPECLKTEDDDWKRVVPHLVGKGRIEQNRNEVLGRGTYHETTIVLWNHILPQSRLLDIHTYPQSHTHHPRTVFFTSLHGPGMGSLWGGEHHVLQSPTPTALVVRQVGSR